MKVLVCGGRKFKNRDLLFGTLDELHRKRPIRQVIHGAAEGADDLAGQWARDRGVPCRTFPVNWEGRRENGRWIYNKAAAFQRNQEMLDVGKPDMTLAFPGQGGTADMVRRSRAEGVRTIQIPADAKLPATA